MFVTRRLALGLLALCALIFGLIFLGRNGLHWPAPVPQPRLARPYGMAPAAFNGFVHACYRARIHPNRIGQTIGDHPLSVGYHKRDGVVKFRGQKLDYTAAVDIGTSDLTRAQINVFLEALASQGFAAFYREKGKWRGHEHIHAIYARLEMKPQLRGQLEEWNRKRRRARRKTYPWQLK